MNRFGYVSIVGRPNVGKSTLLNAILGEKVAIVTHKPQTTRRHLSGIYSDDDSQIVFLDSPGFHESGKPLNQAMIDEVAKVISDADVICVMFEAGIFPTDQDEKLWEIATRKETICLVNKADLLNKDEVGQFAKRLKELLNPSDILFISAKNNDGVKELVAFLKTRIPEGEAHFPKDEYARHSVRFLTSELIREQLFLEVHQELPYSIAVQIDEFKEPQEANGLTVIKATIFVERESQKPMIIGKGGKKIKEIGTRSRGEIEKLVGTKVFLDLHVKVRKDWTKDPRAVKELL
ncbi:MAG: GTPase Era [Pseudomonadota bacterium]